MTSRFSDPITAASLRHLPLAVAAEIQSVARRFDRRQAADARRAAAEFRQVCCPLGEFTVKSLRGRIVFNDFARTFEQSSFGFTLITADAVVQGRQAQQSVVAGIDALVRLRVELIVIIRGGGSKTDLAYLDNDAIACFFNLKPATTDAARTRLSAIRRKFRQAGLDLQLEDGTEVGVCCSLQFDSTILKHRSTHWQRM